MPVKKVTKVKTVDGSFSAFAELDSSGAITGLLDEQGNGIEWPIGFVILDGTAEELDLDLSNSSPAQRRKAIRQLRNRAKDIEVTDTEDYTKKFERVFRKLDDLAERLNLIEKKLNIKYRDIDFGVKQSLEFEAEIIRGEVTHAI